MHALCALCKNIAPISRHHGESEDAEGRSVIEFVCVKCDKDKDKDKDKTETPSTPTTT